ASYGIVHFLLPWRKTSIRRDSAGEVGVVVGIFSTHVQKQNVAIAAHFAVSNVMKHAGVRPGGDDGLICKSARPFPKEFMHILGLNLILLNTRLNKFQHTSEGLFGYVDRTLHELQLTLRFNAAQPVHDGR